MSHPTTSRDPQRAGRHIRGSVPLLIAAGAAAALQAAVTLGAFAWLSRTLPVREVGRFGLYLATISFVLGLDGIRQAIVVASVSAEDKHDGRVRSLAGISLGVGIAVGIGAATIGHVFLSLTTQELAPISLAATLIFVVGPGLGFLEGHKGPQYSVALQSCAWSAAIALAAFASVRQGQAQAAAWSLLVGPVAIAAALFAAGLMIAPSFGFTASERGVASDGMRSHLVTGISGFLDKGALAARSGPIELGYYAPLAEFTGRAGALAGLVSNLFLRDEARSTSQDTVAQFTNPTHRHAIDAFFAAGCVGVISTAAAAESALHLLTGHSNESQVLALRLLLAGLMLTIGAQWSAVTLRARGQFDLYRPYLLSLVAALVLTPLLLPSCGVVGAAILALVVRSADIVLLARARAFLSRWQLAAIAMGTAAALTWAAVGTLGH